MARRLINQAGASGSGGSGGSATGVVPTVVDVGYLPGTQGINVNHYKSSQLNSERFISGCIGTDNLHRAYAYAIHVSAAGAITVGTATAHSLGGSSQSYSTTSFGDVAPGCLACAGAHYPNNAYTITGYLLQVSAAGNISIGSSQYGNYSSSVAWPEGTVTFGIGNWDSSTTSGSQKWCYGGYTNASVPLMHTINGTANQGSNTVGSNGNTCRTWGFPRHFECDAPMAGYADTSTSGTPNTYQYFIWYNGSNQSVNTYLGNLWNRTVSSNDHQYIARFIHKSTNSVYKYLLVNGYTGDAAGEFEYRLLDSSGNVIASGRQSVPWRTAVRVGDSTFSTMFPVANNVYLVIDDQSRYQCYELDIDGSNVITWTKLNDNDGMSLGTSFGFWNYDEGPRSSAQLYSAGPNKEFLVAISKSGVVTFDMTDFVDLSGY